MNNDLFKISLNQGKQFNNYQKNIKRDINKINTNSTHNAKHNIKHNFKHNINHKKIKEGFIIAEQEMMLQPNDEGYISVLQEQQKYTELNNKLSQSDLDDLKRIQSQYNDLIQQYTDIQKSIGSSTLESISRTNSNNPYLGKNIRFTDGTICYVTAQGVAKPYASLDAFNNTVGKNGCPKELIDLNISWLSSYIKDSVLPTKPSLIVGTSMMEGESCGSEGKNVYVSSLINSPSSSYIGCYNDKSASVSSIDNSERAMILNSDIIGYTTYEKCQDYALNNGYQYFGMQDYKQDGTAQCLVSNDIDRTKMYGDGSIQISSITPIWSSNTVLGQPNIAQLTGSGQITITDSGGTVVSNVNPEVTECSNWGTITVSSATYGGNCHAPIGNVTSQVADDLKCNYTGSCSIPISNTTFGDPASGCVKSFDIAYTCGTTNFSQNIPSAEGQTMILSCDDYIQNTCQFYLILQDDGNLCIYKGTDPSNNKGFIWCAMTNGKQTGPNPEWIASKGKYGRNYLKTGETLGSEEWIGSTDGSLKLIMQTDGNLVLYTSTVTKGCVNGSNNYTYGGPWVNAVYQLNTNGNKYSLGKVGYIDSESKIREYPDSMLGFSNDYQIYQNTTSDGNDVSSLTVTDQNACQTACDNNDNCAGYVYQGISSTCWLKNRNTFPKGDKQSNSSTILGIRKPKLDGSTTCSNQIVDIDSLQYDNYVKGDPMTPDTQCNMSLVSQEDKLKLDNIKTKLSTLGQDIVTKMEKLYSEDNKIYEKLDMNDQQFKKDLEKYKNTIIKIRRELEIDSKSNIEGMQNMENSLDMNDINGMLSDTDLRVLQENYSYLLWSILAVGLLTVTINTMKK